MFRGDLIHQFSNVGHFSPGRTFPGFVRREDSLRIHLGPREARRIEMREGDLLSLDAPGQTVSLLAYDGRGRPALDLLDTMLVRK